MVCRKVLDERGIFTCDMDELGEQFDEIDSTLTLLATHPGNAQDAELMFAPGGRTLGHGASPACERDRRGTAPARLDRRCTRVFASPARATTRMAARPGGAVMQERSGRISPALECYSMSYGRRSRAPSPSGPSRDCCCYSMQSIASCAADECRRERHRRGALRWLTLSDSCVERPRWLLPAGW